MSISKSRVFVVLGAALTLCFAGSASADSARKLERKITTADVRALDISEIARPIDQLPDELEPRPEDPDVADTALVFTNIYNRAARVRCVAFDKQGEAIGRTSTRIPPRGVRYVLASDMSDGEDFVGQVQCIPYGRIVGSAVFIGPGLTDVPVRTGKIGKSRIYFPLVAHY